MLLKTTPVLVALCRPAVSHRRPCRRHDVRRPVDARRQEHAVERRLRRRHPAPVERHGRFGALRQRAVTGGELCFKLAEPSPHGVDVVLRQRPIAIAKGHHYQLRLKVHATAPTKVRPRLSKISVPYTELWGATIDADTTAKTYAATYDGTADDDSVELAIEFGGPLAGKPPLTVCIDDVELNDPQFEAPIAAGARRLGRAREPGRLPARLRQDRDGGDQVGGAGRMAARRQGRQGARQRQDPPVRRRQVVGRAGAADRLLVVQRRRQGLQAEGRQGREPAVRDRQRRLQAPQARRAGVLLPAAQRRPDQDAVRRIEGLRTPGRARRRQERPLRQGGEVRLQPGRQRRLVRRRRPRQVPGQRRLSPSGRCRTNTRR